MSRARPGGPWAALAWGCSLLLLTGCAGGGAGSTLGPSGSTGGSHPSATTPTVRPTWTPSAAEQATPNEPTNSPRPRKGSTVKHVILVSVDALTPVALDRLPAEKIPHFRTIIEGGMSTMNARTAVEQNVTLPNHVGMLTGRGISVENGGHGVLHNEDLEGDTLQLTSRDPDIETVFDVVHDAGGTTALFTGKEKFNIFEDTDPAALDTFVVNPDEPALANAAAARIAADQPTFTMVHLAGPDVAGHARGGLSPAYLRAVQQADTDLGVVMEALDDTAWSSTRLILTADHGVTEGAHQHGARIPSNWTIPFVVYGAGVSRGDLYRANPRFADPGTSMPGWDGAQPVRNLDAANLVTRSLHLGAVPGSFDRPQVRVKAKR